MRHSTRMPGLRSARVRKPAVRLSRDHTAFVGAKVPAWKRL
jgi:hypothetical protein